MVNGEQKFSLRDEAATGARGEGRVPQAQEWRQGQVGPV